MTFIEKFGKFLAGEGVGMYKSEPLMNSARFDTTDGTLPDPRMKIVDWPIWRLRLHTPHRRHGGNAAAARA